MGLQFSGLDSLSCKYLWSYGRDWSVKSVRRNASATLNRATLPVGE